MDIVLVDSIVRKVLCAGLLICLIMMAWYLWRIIRMMRLEQKWNKKDIPDHKTDNYDKNKSINR